MKENKGINQREQKIINVLKTVEAFLKTGKTNEELASILGFSSSSVGRYLTDKETITLYLGTRVYEEIQIKLKENKINGLSKGGKVTQSRYYQIRDIDGKYSGNKKK